MLCNYVLHELQVQPDIFCCVLSPDLFVPRCVKCQFCMAEGQNYMTNWQSERQKNSRWKTTSPQNKNRQEYGERFLQCNSSYLISKTEFLIHCLFNDPTYPPTWTLVSTYSSRPSHLEICGLQRYIGYLAGKFWTRFFLSTRPLNILQGYLRVRNCCINGSKPVF